MMAENAQKIMVVPVNVIVCKHYRTYVECPLNADNEMIRTLTAQHIIDGQNSVLVRDPDFYGIEPLDIHHPTGTGRVDHMKQVMLFPAPLFLHHPEPPWRLF